MEILVFSAGYTFYYQISYYHNKMTTFRPFEPKDLFRFNSVNLDPLTETVRMIKSGLRFKFFKIKYGLPFYLQYLVNWPEYFLVAEHVTGQIMGYSEKYSIMFFHFNFMF